MVIPQRLKAPQGHPLYRPTAPATLFSADQTSTLTWFVPLTLGLGPPAPGPKGGPDPPLSLQIRIWARPNAIAEGHGMYALNVTGPILNFFANHYNTPYPLPKSGE